MSSSLEADSCISRGMWIKVAVSDGLVGVHVGACSFQMTAFKLEVVNNAYSNRSGTSVEHTSRTGPAVFRKSYIPSGILSRAFSPY